MFKIPYSIEKSQKTVKIVQKMVKNGAKNVQKVIAAAVSRTLVATATTWSPNH